jgi:hypothetical protein
MNFKVIKINWDNHKQIAFDVFRERKTIKLDEFEEYKDCLYQIYGKSIIYGENKLLYIGQTNNLKSRTNKHLNLEFNRVINLSLTIGKIEVNDSSPTVKLELIEGILICYVKPSYNSANINNIPRISKTDQILILNKGYRGSLPLECSNYWWLSPEQQNLI